MILCCNLRYIINFLSPYMFMIINLMVENWNFPQLLEMVISDLISYFCFLSFFTLLLVNFFSLFYCELISSVLFIGGWVMIRIINVIIFDNKHGCWRHNANIWWFFFCFVWKFKHIILVSSYQHTVWFLWC